MTVFIFLASLLGCIIIGVPVAFSLLLCGLALMVHLDMFDIQIMAQNLRRQIGRASCRERV